MDKEIKEELENISLQEELMSLSVEDIMRDTHLKREVAQVLYDSFRDTSDYTTYTGEEFDAWLRSFL